MTREIDCRNAEIVVIPTSIAYSVDRKIDARSAKMLLIYPDDLGPERFMDTLETIKLYLGGTK